MAQDKKLTFQRLSQLWRDDSVEILPSAGKKYVIVSDVHMGDGGPADDFRGNVEVMQRALDFYNRTGYTLILLGDIEELWQFDLHEILATYGKKIYDKIRAFGKERIYRVFGNHDLDWQLFDPLQGQKAACKWAVEALKLSDSRGVPSVLLVHGHQGSTESDKNSWISRILVRGVWKPVEPFATKIGLYGHPAATKSQIAKNYEKILYSWAKENSVILICGHSHRAIYAAKSFITILREQIRALQGEILTLVGNKSEIKKRIKQIEKLNQKLAEEMLKRRDINNTALTPLPCYFNSGCALYDDGITTLEIDDGVIRLVKWHRKLRDGLPFTIFNDGSGKTLDDYAAAVRA